MSFRQYQELVVFNDHGLGDLNSTDQVANHIRGLLIGGGTIGTARITETAIEVWGSDDLTAFTNALGTASGGRKVIKGLGEAPAIEGCADPRADIEAKLRMFGEN